MEHIDITHIDSVTKKTGKRENGQVWKKGYFGVDVKRKEEPTEEGKTKISRSKMELFL